MSGTSLAMGRQIEEYLQAVNRGRRKTDRIWLSVGEVAKANECNKVTARKYLSMLVAAGVVCDGDVRGRGGWRKVYAIRSETQQ